MRNFLFKVIASVAALAVLFCLLLGPMLLFCLYYNIDLNAEGSNGEIWLLVIGGGMGAGLARLVYWWIYCIVGGYSEQEH